MLQRPLASKRTLLETPEGITLASEHFLKTPLGSSPRTAAPGPGLVYFTGSIALASGHLSITGSGVLDANGIHVRKNAATGFDRGAALQITIKINSAGFASIHLSQAASFHNTNARHVIYLFSDGRILARMDNITGGETGDEHVGIAFLGQSYTLQLQPRTGGGFLAWITGGHCRSKKLIAIDHNYNASTIYPAINVRSGTLLVDKIRVHTKQTKKLIPCAYNAGEIVGGHYRICIGYYEPQTRSIGAQVNNPVLTPTAAWETFGGSQVLNAPWLIRDGGTWYLYYNSAPVPGCQIGLATSTDQGLTWTKHPSNPVFAKSSTPSDWHGHGLLFPVVWKDPAAAPTHRWRAITGAFDSAGKITSGLWYARAPEGPWTPEPTNPILPLGTGSDQDTNRIIPAAVVFHSGTGYFFYQGTKTGSFPDGGHCMLATFNPTSPTGSFTKVGIAFAPRTAATQNLTASVPDGSSSCSVANGTVFAAGEVCILADPDGNVHQCKVVRTEQTTVHFTPPARTAINASGKIESTLQSVVPRSVWKSGNIWSAIATSYQAGYLSGNAFVETSYLVFGTSPTNWHYDHYHSPPQWLPLLGVVPASSDHGYCGRCQENHCLLRDSVTLEPVTLDIA